MLSRAICGPALSWIDPIYHCPGFKPLHAYAPIIHVAKHNLDIGHCLGMDKKILSIIATVIARALFFSFFKPVPPMGPQSFQIRSDTEQTPLFFLVLFSFISNHPLRTPTNIIAHNQPLGGIGLLTGYRWIPWPVPTLAPFNRTPKCHVWISQSGSPLSCGQHPTGHIVIDIFPKRERSPDRFPRHRFHGGFFDLHPRASLLGQFCRRNTVFPSVLVSFCQKNILADPPQHLHP